MGFITALERMANDKRRQAIALEAARLMYERVESEYYTAKRKAAKRLCRRGCKPEDLPSNAEIRDLIQTFARLHEGEKRTANLRAMRLEALKLMRRLRQFKPRLIGSVMTGHVRAGSDIDLHLFPEGAALCHTLQVFELARDERPYDEEFLLAALLHDVGKGIDPADHVAAGLQALGGLITERTHWLIEHHMLAHEYRMGTLSAGKR